MNRDNKGILEKAGEGLDNMANAAKNSAKNARDTLFGKPEEEKTLGDKGNDFMNRAGEKIEDAGKRAQREAH